MNLNDALSRISRLIRDFLQPAKVRPRTLVIACVTLFVVAVGIRLLHWQNNWLTVDNTMNKTAAGYKKEAQYLTEGDLRSFVRGRSAEPDTSLLTHTPGYPIFIAVVNAVTGHSNVVLRLVHIALGAGGAVLVLLISVDLLPFGAAVLASLFAAVSPQLSFYSVVLLPDSLVGVPLLLAIYLLVRARQRPKAWKIVGAGILIGVACWLRSDAMLLAPFVCLLIPLLFPRNKRLSYAALLITGAVLTIAPITIRNFVVFKSLIPTSLGAGVTLMEGIADYDPGKRFGMEHYDHEVVRQEAGLYNRPDYADELFRPDGIQRERLRVSRAWEVIGRNKLWFTRVMAKRAAQILTYEPVSIISAEPSVSHPLDVTRAELAWHAELPGNDIAAEPITVQPNSDYLLNVSLKTIGGREMIKIGRADTNKTIASATVPDSLDPATTQSGEMKILQIPFVNSSAHQIKIIMVKLDDASSDVGAIDLYRLGAASYVWTKYPRIGVKRLQKFFTTEWMLPLTIVGAVLLFLARRLDTLAVILAIPLYYIITHAPLHLELRYVLPIHYFWAMLVATSLYFIWATCWKLVRQFKSSQLQA
jgi:hypothetical protein